MRENKYGILASRSVSLVKLVLFGILFFSKHSELGSTFNRNNNASEFTVLSGIEHLRNKTNARDYFRDEYGDLNSLLSEQGKDSLLSGIFSHTKNNSKIANSFEKLENVREDFLNNWAFNIKYGSKKVVEEANLSMLLYFVKQRNNTRTIKSLSGGESEEGIVVPSDHKQCWETYLRLVRRYKYEFFNRDFETQKRSDIETLDNENKASSKYANNERSKVKELLKKGLDVFQYSNDVIDSFGLEGTFKLVEPEGSGQNRRLALIRDNLVRSLEEENNKKCADKRLEKEKFLLRYTCELYMICRDKVKKMTEEFDDYDFRKVPIEGKIYKTWRDLYARSPSNSLWFLFKKLIEIRGDLTVFNLSNGDIPLLPDNNRMKLPPNPPVFFEFTTVPRICSNNLVALSMNYGYRLRLGVKKVPKYISYGKLHRYFENSLTSSYTSLNLCKRAIKLLTMYEAHYYKSIDEYRPNPDSSFYWQTPDWETFSGYVSYLPISEKLLYPGRNQFVWCLMWSCTEYTKTFSHYRINPIKVRVRSVLHLPMRMQTLGMNPTIESCMVFLRFFWLAKLIKVNQRNYRPLELDSKSDVLFDYSSLYYVCVTILKCRTTYHRAYLKHFYPEEINDKILKLYDTQDPLNVYSNLNNRFMLINTPKIRSLKKAKTILLIITSSVLFSAMTGILILNIITGTTLQNNQLLRSGFNNPLRELSHLDEYKF